MSARPEPRPLRTVRIVLPAYNEAENLPSLLAGVTEAMEDNLLPYQVIVVDDGSTDRTAAIAKQHGDRSPIRVVQHAANLGLGAAIRDGLQEALQLSNERDVIVTMDADDTHTPGLIVRMVRMLGEGYDVVIASRYQPESRVYGVPWSRRVMSGGASLLMRILFPIRGVRDFTCGYRAYRAAVLREAVAQYGGNFVNQEGFQCMVDILLKLRRMDLIFGEVPMLLRYDRKEGQSKMRVWRTATNTLGLLVRRKFGSDK